MKFDPTIVQTRYASPLGPMIVAATAHGLAGLWFEGQKHLPDTHTWPQQPGHRGQGVASASHCSAVRFQTPQPLSGARRSGVLEISTGSPM